MKSTASVLEQAGLGALADDTDSPSANVTTVVATIGGVVPTKLFLRAVATQ